jgi:hypothetical protein
MPVESMSMRALIGMVQAIFGEIRACARASGGLTSSPDDEVGHRKASQQPLRAVGETVRVKKMSCAHGKPAIGSAQDRRLP